MQAELRDMGICVNHKRIERLMKLANLQGVVDDNYLGRLATTMLAG
jgi:hypothetical protein